MTDRPAEARPPGRAIAWFTRDLRLDDQPALAGALRGAAEIVPLFLWDPAILDGGRLADVRLDLLRRALASLDGSLREHGGRLVVRRGDPAAVIAELVRATGARTVHASRDYTPFARRRFARVAAAAEEAGARLVLHAGTLLVEPEATGDRKVFTAFHRRWLAAEMRPPLADGVGRIRVPEDVAGEAGPASAGPASAGDPRAEAEARLHGFASSRAGDYASDRGRLDRDGTSRLSAALHLGLVSARRVFDAIPDDAFRRQLAWRDWASHLLWFHPESLAGGWDPAFRAFPWRDDPAGFAAWTEGRTGYPAVDAAMRQLRAEGWLNNRARMIAASFLAKDLLIDWRQGERWFLRHLVDGDVANNSLGWQWTAGVGTDAAPYMRILNPSLQGERFDPDGAWVRRWVPELRDADPAWIHRPWTAPDDARRRIASYPPPIVDHAEARRHALVIRGDLVRDRAASGVPYAPDA